MVTKKKQSGTVKAQAKTAPRASSKKVLKKTASRAVKTQASKSKKAVVSIVMPAYNAASYIDDTIHSVLGQTYEDWELIIVDDHSTDNTLEVVGQFKSERIRVIACKKNGGAAKARNRGVKAARGRFIAFIDADDLWQPRKLERQLAFMEEKDCAFAFGSYVFADAKGKPKGKVVRVPAVVSKGFLMRKNIFLPSTMIFDVKKISKDEIKIQDDDVMGMWQRLIEKAGAAYGLNDVVAICGYDPKLSLFGRLRRGV